MVNDYLKSAYTELFGNFPFSFDETGEVLFVNKASKREVSMFENLHKCTILSLAYLTDEDIQKTKPFNAVSRLIH